jgi:ABC-type hemin transport system ATPase subunit
MTEQQRLALAKVLNRAVQTAIRNRQLTADEYADIVTCTAYLQSLDAIKQPAPRLQ